MQIRLLGQPLWPLPWFVLLFVVIWVIAIIVEVKPVNDVLSKQALSEGWASGWALTHLFGFMIAGFLLPDHWFLLFWAGFLWEVWEYGVWCAMGKKSPYWYYVAFDIVLNTIGIAVGMTLRKLVSAKQASQRKVALAQFISVATFSVLLLFSDDRWKYINADAIVGRQCRCSKDCDYDIENAPKKV